jgi:hypothetical protein
VSRFGHVLEEVQRGAITPRPCGSGERLSSVLHNEDRHGGENLSAKDGSESITYQTHHANLRFRVCVDVSLRGSEVRVPRELLNVLQ